MKNAWKPVRQLCSWGVFALFSVAAHASGTLIIGPVPAGTPLDILSNVNAEFPGATYIDAGSAGAVTASTFTANSYDLVVVVQPVSPATPSDPPSFEAGNMAAIMAAIQNRSATAFAFFADSGGSGRVPPVTYTNATVDLASRLNTIGSLGIALSGSNPFVGSDENQVLNTISPFSAGFGSALRGGFFHYLGNVPAPNTLYVNPTNTLPAAESTALQEGVYGVFIPSVQSYAGSGACVMAFTDLTLLESRDGVYAANSGKIGAPITAAAGAAGACSFAVDLLPTISGPAAPAIGSPAPYMVVVTNQGALTSTNGTVVISLPANLVLAPTVPTGCTRNSDTQMTCDLTVLAPGGLATNANVGISFSATPTSVVPGAGISVVVFSVANEANTTNNDTQLPLAGGAAPTSVPTLNQYGFLLLVLSMLGVGAAHLRRHPRAKTGSKSQP